MNTLMMVSYFVLWAVVLLLVFALAVLARQVGLLHSRIAPTGARMTDAGPQIGEQVPARTVTDIFGQQIELGGAKAKPTLLVFMSATCSVCSDVAPAVLALWKSERRQFDFAIISVGGSEQDNREFINHFALNPIPYVLSYDVGVAYKVLNPPYGVFLDNTGVVKAKGLVNRREHLDSLLNAAELGEPTFESYMRRRMVDPAMNPMPSTSE